MALAKRKIKFMGLKKKIVLMIIMATFLSVIAAWATNIAATLALDHYFDSATLWKEKTEEKAAEVQEYVTENKLSSKDAKQIRQWRKDNSSVYVYVYDGDQALYESTESPASYGVERYSKLKFSDKTVDMYTFYALDYKYYTMAFMLSVGVGVLIFFTIILRRVQRIVNEIDRLEKDINILEGGSLEHKIKANGDDEIASLERSIDSMRIALKNNIEREEKLTRANNELVTRMAHDLRTPLTSMLLYLDLLDHGKYADEEELRRYIHISQQKAVHIKTMSDQLFERFLVSKDDGESIDEPETIRYALEDPLSVFLMNMSDRGFQVDADVNWPEGEVTVSESYIERILDNITSNIYKYADQESPISLVLKQRADDLILSVSNRVKEPREGSESNRIGLGNIALMMEKMGGEMKVHRSEEPENEIFEIELAFPVQNV